jgi:lysine/ornithine N-monooxygenase
MPHARRIAVVGAGQSAAEIFMDLQGRPGAPQVDLVTRARSIRPADDSPFVNEIFNAEFTDYTFSRSDEERAALLDEFWHTNYAVADLALIQQIYAAFYQQRVTGGNRLRLLRRHDIRHVTADAQGVHLALWDQNALREHSVRYDAVVLATGYAREHHKALLAPLAGYLGDYDGRPALPRAGHARLSSGHLPAGRLRGFARAQRHVAVGHLGQDGRNRQRPAGHTGRRRRRSLRPRHEAHADLKTPSRAR